MLKRWKRRAGWLKGETYALYLAYRDPRTPWYAKVFVAFVVGYAFSPIDLIPDPIPILGYLDDLLLVPLGIALALKMIPPAVLDECREQAQLTMEEGNPTNWKAAAAVIAIWLVIAVAIIYAVARLCLQ
ncbi:MAG: YkvA family protein [Anaerolineae bacterium]|jgi:uncharacterized membrane protein YkvA (DUF1232 family)